MVCPFCTIEPNRILTECESAVAILDGYPLSEGHALVVPGRQVTSIFDLSADEQAAIWQLAQGFARASPPNTA